MIRIGIRELRQNASRYLLRVKAGETVEVTERGRLVALLVPPGPSATARDRLVASGHLIAAARPLQLPRPAMPLSGAADSGSVLDEQRDERR